jgi:four helix bundle protein
MSSDLQFVEDLAFFGKLTATSDAIYSVVSNWSILGQETVGRQLIRSVDSIGANLVEGDGRQTQADSIRFFVIARASARESVYWLQRAQVRGFLTAGQFAEFTDSVDHAVKSINKLIAYRRTVSKRSSVREQPSDYVAGDADLPDPAITKSQSRERNPVPSPTWNREPKTGNPFPTGNRQPKTGNPFPSPTVNRVPRTGNPFPTGNREPGTENPFPTVNREPRTGNPFPTGNREPGTGNPKSPPFFVKGRELRTADLHLPS